MWVGYGFYVYYAKHGMFCLHLHIRFERPVELYGMALAWHSASISEYIPSALGLVGDTAVLRMDLPVPTGEGSVGGRGEDGVVHTRLPWVQGGQLLVEGVRCNLVGTG